MRVRGGQAAVPHSAHGRLLGHTVQSATAVQAAAASGVLAAKVTTRSLLSRSKRDEGILRSARRIMRLPPVRQADRSGRLAGAAFLGRQRRPYSGPPRGRLPVPSHRRHRLRADGDRHDDPGLFRRPDVPGSGSPSHRKRAIDDAAGVDERARRLLRGSRTLLRNAVQDSARARRAASSNA